MMPLFSEEDTSLIDMPPTELFTLAYLKFGSILLGQLDEWMERRPASIILPNRFNHITNSTSTTSLHFTPFHRANRKRHIPLFCPSVVAPPIYLSISLLLSSNRTMERDCCWIRMGTEDGAGCGQLMLLVVTALETVQDCSRYILLTRFYIF